MKWMLLPALLVLAACGQQPDAHWLGYIEGEPALIAAPQPGWITSLNVARGSDVKMGDALFTLDATREIAARDAARAAITSAKEQQSQAEAQSTQARAQTAQVSADIAKSQKEYERQQDLVRTGASPKRDLETAQAAYDSDRARRTQMTALQTQAEATRRQAEALQRSAEASLMTAEFNLSQRSVESLVTGRVQDIYFREGEYANGGVPVVSVLPPQNVFVRFFVPETQIAALQIGTRVHLSCDSCPANLVGTIRFISAQAEYTPPVIYSVGNRERLVFKAEAYVDTDLPFRPGLPMEVWPQPSRTP